MQTIIHNIGTIFGTRSYRRIHWLFIALIAMCFIAMPQQPPVDWYLNTHGFWDDIPRTYLNNPNFVYPPWGLVLLLPYLLIGAAGSRVMSVLAVGWLAYRSRWPLWAFLAAVLSPYFFVTMATSNMDVLVTVLPILFWQTAQGKRWEIPVRGLALGFMLLKPQITALVILYLLWSSRAEWKRLLAAGGVAAALVVPISLIGSPPLILQWFNNLLHPSEQNTFFWSINNVSLTSRFGWLIGLVILVTSAALMALLVHKGWVRWSGNLSLAALLLGSMFLMPYSSQQSLSAGLVFVPSWVGWLVQWLVGGFGLASVVYLGHIAELTFGMAFVSMLAWGVINRKQAAVSPGESGESQ